MTIHRRVLQPMLTAAGILVFLPSVASSQECSLASLPGCGLPESAASSVSDVVGNPQTLNEVVRQLAAATSLSKLLGDLNLEFKTFYSSDSANTSLGLYYAYSKRFARSPFDVNRAVYSGFFASIDGVGNIAFNRDLNPRNFLDTKLSIHGFRSQGGVRGTVDDSTAAALTDSALALAAIEDQTELGRRAPATIRMITDHLSTQFYGDLAIAASLESDQSFDEKQLVYSGTFGLDIKAWSRNSAWARFNLFDWPFALVRYLTSVDAAIAPKGTNIPTVLLQVAAVDPTDSPEREALGETGLYPRFSAEAAFRSLIARTSGDELYFDAGIRFYQEIGASEAIKALGRDNSLYFVLTLSGIQGVFFSYSTGRLPLDLQDDQVYELGARFQF